ASVLVNRESDCYGNSDGTQIRRAPMVHRGSLARIRWRVASQFAADRRGGGVLYPGIAAVLRVRKGGCSGFAVSQAVNGSCCCLGDGRAGGLALFADENVSRGPEICFDGVRCLAADCIGGNEQRPIQPAWAGLF